MKTLRTIFLLGVFTLLAFADSTELLRPTMDADFGSATWVTTNCGIATYQANSTSGSLGRDAAGQSTSVSLGLSSSTAGTRNTSRTYSSWASTSNTYSALTLNINSSGSANGDDIPGEACIAYSLDSGGTWTQIRCTATSWARTTDTITLSTSQSLSQIMVGTCSHTPRTVSGGGDIFTSAASVTVYDIWTSGTISSGAAGNGSSAGSTAQPVQFN